MNTLNTTNDYEKNFENTLSNALKLFDIKISKEYLDWFAYNPLYPTLNLLERAFKQMGFSSLVVQIKIEKLNQIPLPAITHLSDGVGRFVIITTITDDKVIIHDSVNGYQTLSKVDFFQDSNGVFLLLEKENKPTLSISSLEENNGKKIKYLTSFLVLSLFSLVLLNPSKANLFYFFIGLSGFVLSLTIKLVESNIVLNSFCKIGSNIDCNTVLNSKGSYIFGTVKASDLSLFWYLFIFIFTLLSTLKESQYHLLNLLGYLSILYLPYSIIYQSLVIRKWCMLCLSIQFLILVHFLYSLLHVPINSLSEMNIKADVLSLPIILLCFALTLLLKIYLEKNSRAKELSLSRNLFSLDEEILEHYLKGKPTIATNLGKASINMISSPKDVEITIVLNPLCEACKKAFEKLLRLHLVRPSIFINVIMVKKWNSKEEDEIFKLIFSEEIENRFSILKAVMTGEKYKSGESNMEQSHDFMETHQNWFEKSGLEYTPRYFMNGKLVPEKYNLDDIMYHLLHFEKHLNNE
ncbi:vitamin K epoxide reductase family protein [Flagellimonas meridianipacifica]|uniref:Peptidase C39-like protein n=1 Tax=Flagellimonas meridianipacifica TaxID=1080225 RepID=A0A2T0MCQ4_9FLAO|nr:vitamin K epoxide reductase family protein [Allomuricauda pacifica]PRX55263.1 peptidase C39-like protein [Allomuricauda pacifica]